MRRLVFVTIAAACAAVSFAQAPSASFKIGAKAFNFSLFELRDGVYGLYDPLTFSDGGSTVTISHLEMDSDPFISYAVGIVNSTAIVQNFAFSFTVPIVTVTGPNVVAGSLVGGLTDANGNGVAVSTFLTPTLQESFLGNPNTNMNVSVGTGATHGPGTPGSLYTYGAFNSGSIPGPVGTWTSLQVNLSLGLTGGGDAAALTGFTSITPVPEPATMAVLALGAVGMAARRRRK